MALWAFVSDIHGNRSALERAVALSEAVSADHFVCLGDVIGRGDPTGCVEWVQRRAAIAIVGNRDLDYLDRVPPALQAVVRSWPNEALAAEFVASHGDPRLHRVLNSSAERDGFRRAGTYMADRAARVWLFGHTHRARVWELGNDGPRLLALAPASATTLEIGGGARYVVNVGTTGLPLPGRGAASFVLYDDVQRRLDIVPLPRVSAPRVSVPRRHLHAEVLADVR